MEVVLDVVGHQGAKIRLTVLYSWYPCNIQYELYS
jgi:hypothetical protein